MNLTFAENNARRFGSDQPPSIFSEPVPAESLSLHSETLALFRANLFGRRRSGVFFADQAVSPAASAAPSPSTPTLGTVVMQTPRPPAFR